ncbi:hypothetical protein [Butyrivibrio sp. M55]|uniref:hypothetical protein n=1 Tax=Butyrivibrio sp. M55 TaxID=1855323 RepID=UPI0008ED105A|nr:hypothetical protein [Butyrivibrio sp. M55]SFU38976.1 hypothetical protein SAMN05216540_101454 [Butyrivibrio sp. M55]
MKKSDILKQVRILMHITCTKGFARHKKAVDDFFDKSTYYDMCTKIDFRDDGSAELYTHERGKKIVSYVTDDEKVVVFEILSNLIWGDAYEMYECNEQEYCDRSFELIGEPYNTWHKRGITIFNLGDIGDCHKDIG